MKPSAVIAISVLACAHAACQRTETALSVQRLTINDSSGRPRIELCVRDGQPIISIADSDGVTRVAITVNEKVENGVSALVLSSHAGRPAVVIGQGADGGSVQLFDDGRVPRATLCVQNRGALLAMNSGTADRPRRFSITASCAEDGCDVDVSNVDEAVRLVAPAAGPAMIKRENDRQVLWQTPAD